MIVIFKDIRLRNHTVPDQDSLRKFTSGQVRVDMNQELVIVKMQKKKKAGGGGGWGCQGGCELRLGYCKMQKKSWGGGGWDMGDGGSGYSWVIRVDVNQELKLL